jgi:uncharacterized protein YcbK (DUF882 family)
MWVAAPEVISLLAALALMMFSSFARAQTADPEQQAVEPEQGSYYGRRHDPDCGAGTSTAEYRLKIAQLRMPDDSLPEPRWVGPYRELRLRAAHGDETIVVVPFDENGDVTEDAAKQIADVFCGTRSHCSTSVDARLIRLLYVIAHHFDAREIVVVSGIRFPEEDGRTSNHHQGRAVDIIVPRVPNEEVAAYARELGHVGVGYYPISGFTHLDVRDRSFFWRDPSGPGQPICTQAILPDVAREVDELYNASFEDPRTWAPVEMPPEPEDPGAKPERRADRLDDIDDEAAIAAVFDAELRTDLRQASNEMNAWRERRAAAERRREERRQREAEQQAEAAQAVPESTPPVAASSDSSVGNAAEGSASTPAPASAEASPTPEPRTPNPAQLSSNTTSPPTTVATALPGTS